MFSATLEVLRKMINYGPTRDMRGEAKGAYREMTSFEFFFLFCICWIEFLESMIFFAEHYRKNL